MMAGIPCKVWLRHLQAPPCTRRHLGVSERLVGTIGPGMFAAWKGSRTMKNEACLSRTRCYARPLLALRPLLCALLTPLSVGRRNWTMPHTAAGSPFPRLVWWAGKPGWLETNNDSECTPTYACHALSCDAASPAVREPTAPGRSSLPRLGSAGAGALGSPTQLALL